MSEELIQRNVLSEPEKMGEWTFYNLGATSLKELKAAKLIPNYDYGELEKKKPDALIVKKPHIIAVIEYKTPQELRTKAQIKAAVKQEIDVAAVLHAKAYIVTDGTKSFWINPASGNEILQENGSRITLNFDRTSLECIKLLQKICVSVSAANDKLLPVASVDPLPLARQVWQDLWAVSGATPENCLYTFVEIFIFKYLSDLGVLTGMYSFYHLIAQYGENNTDESILTTYAANIRPHIKKLFPANPKDRTTIINGTIFVSKDDEAVEGYATVFRRILERFSDFGSLENIDYDFKSKLFETFLKQSISKKNWGQYFTPLKVVRAIVRMVDLAPGMIVCDPACGVGKFLLELVLNDLPRFYEIDGDTLNPQITLVGLDKGFDREEQKTIILAKANMLIYLSALLKEHHSTEITKQFAQLFNDTFLLQTNSILGTLAHPENEKYDLILTNPPYVMSGSSNLKEEIGKSQRLKTHYSVSALGIEGLFMEWIVRALKPGGKAFIVVPDGVMNRGNDKKMRDFILEHCNLDGVISLPLNTFFTTNKKTYIVALTKKIPAKVGGVATLPRQTTPVFTYFCSEIGETRDMYRFDMEQNDLEQATRLFNMFKGAKEHFTTEDKRCKIVGIDAFYKGLHWCIERWWNKEERIALGIEDKPLEIQVSEFRMMINAAMETLSEYDEPLSELEKYDERFSKRFLLSELFSTIKGKAKYTRKYGELRKGEYPVYSASGNAPLTYIDSYDYDGRYMTWATNGFAGTILILEGKFSVNGDRGVLVPKDGRRDIDLDYMRFTLEPLFRELAKGRKGDKGEDEFTKLYPSMIDSIYVPVPVDEDGTISLAIQQKIAKQYLLIEQCKKEIADKLNALIQKKVSF